MRAFAAALSVGIFLAASGASAQTASQAPVVNSTQRVAEATSPDYTAVYCSSYVSDEKPSTDTLLISGEESNVKVIFGRGDYIYVNKGSVQGVKVGDRYSVIRPIVEENKVQWFKWQEKLMKAMGTVYKDAGQLVITTVQPNVSIGQISFSCDYMQRGDILRPYQERPSPPYKPAAKFDHFAPVSGKAVGMLVVGPEFTDLYGKNSIAYVNLGNKQGVKVGDYLRIFRYQGSLAETAPNTKGVQYKLYGYGSTPTKYEWNDLPREVLGEGVVINTSNNSASVFITYSRIEAYAGDYVEIE
ncbi:MAG TPA: hypothetical protein VII25_03715 [Candidatus Acidoferrum sp.]|jgi:hypothetical protein